MDHILKIRIQEKELAEGKRPPLCDSCNDSLQPDEPIESCEACLTVKQSSQCIVLCGECYHLYSFLDRCRHDHPSSYTLFCLILHPDRFNEVVCDSCRKRFHSRLPIILAESESPRITTSVKYSLSQEMQFT